MKNQSKKNQSLIIEMFYSDSIADKFVLLLIITLTALIIFGLTSLLYLLLTDPSSFDNVGGVIMSSFVVLRQQISYRGGGIEIDLEPYGYEGQAMTAYQNYLGGGLLGAIQNDCTITDWQDDTELQAIAEKLSRYFHSLTVHEDEWESCTYEQNQKRPTSAY